MPSIANILNKLKTTIVQTQTKKIDDKLDQAVKDIVAYKSHSGRNGYIELVRSLVSKTADIKISGILLRRQMAACRFRLSDICFGCLDVC